jgi:hypothetical protein
VPAVIPDGEAPAPDIALPPVASATPAPAARR